MQVAKAEMEAITSELRLRTALLSKLPSASKYNLREGKQVLVYREKEKPYKWTGPYKIVRIDDKQVFIDRNGEEIQHSRAYVKPYIDESHDHAFETRYNMVQPISLVKQELFKVNLTKVLHPQDPRCNLSEFVDAKYKEIKGLLDKGTWKVELKEDIPEGSNILTGRFVLCIKNVNIDQELYMARFVVQGQKDKEKKFIVHDSTNLRQSSTRLLVAIAAIFGFRIWSHDIKQAYLQSSQTLMRKVYLKPSKEFEVSEGELLELLKPLYGLFDSGDYWNRTMTAHLMNDLGMESNDGDLSLFTKHVDFKLLGLIGTYMDDALICGNAEFLNLTEKTLEKFESRARELDDANFAGVRVKATEFGFKFSQENYARGLRILPTDKNFGDFKSLRHKLAWLTHTRPEICCAVNTAAQVTEEKFGKDSVKLINKS